MSLTASACAGGGGGQLLEDDPVLRPYTSQKGTLRTLHGLGDVLAVAVVAAAAAEIYLRIESRATEGEAPAGGFDLLHEGAHSLQRPRV
eukprot:SM000013S26586  [mRNA]  locus=s13:1208696:1209101:+ [translate_table: standard]